jgi:hypothetical protein
MFMDFLGYGNHVSLYSEEISPGGEGLGVSLSLMDMCRADSSLRIRPKHSPMSR